MSRCKEKQRAYGREWTARKRADPAWWAEKLAQQRARRVNANIALTAKARQVLGNKCVHCGFTDPRALQFDHIAGNGHQELKGKLRISRAVMLKRIIAGDSRYQLLCANCNWIKRWDKGEAKGRPVVLTLAQCV